VPHHKRTDYEYKSWSSGVPVPDGWERCPGYADVVRRLKVAPPVIEDNPAEAKIEDASSPQSN